MIEYDFTWVFVATVIEWSFFAYNWNVQSKIFHVAKQAVP